MKHEIILNAHWWNHVKTLKTDWPDWLRFTSTAVSLCFVLMADCPFNCLEEKKHKLWFNWSALMQVLFSEACYSGVYHINEKNGQTW